MDERTVRALGRAWLDDRPWRVLTRLTELDDRFAGHPGEREAAAIVAEALADAGASDVHEEPFEVRRWSRGGADLAVTVRDRDLHRSFEAVALPYTPAYEGTAPLVDAGYGTPEELADADASGAIALTSTGTPPDYDRPYHRVEKLGHAAAAGAEAFVFVNHVPGQLPPTGALEFGAEAGLPGVGVSKETGAWLREYADEGARTRLRVDAGTEPATSRNVVGNVGPATDERLLVLAHYDAHDVGEGALDNGCGVATVVGMTEVLADLDLERGVRIAAVSGEEVGLLGSESLAETLDPASIHAVVNVDGAGRFRNLTAITHTSTALSDRVEAVLDAVGHPVTVGERPHPYSDHWPFLRAGVPSLQLHSDEPGTEGVWDRGWTHTRADTRDKADRRTIREHAMLAALIVRDVADAAVPRVDPDDVRERLIEAGTDEGMRAAGSWPDEWD
jgi:Zn-dependent M28 family amino/carboxypeptidase